jgi:hypothetical protein
MKIILQVLAERVPLLRTINQSGHANPRASRPVISTEVAHSLIVDRAVEKSASLPVPSTQPQPASLPLHVPGLIPDTGARKKYISKKRKILRRRKSVSKHHDLPRNSPQLHHDLPSRNTTKTQKPPAKTTLNHKNIFSTSQPQNPSG